MELSDYLRLIRVHWLPLVLAMMLGAVAAWGWSSLQPRVYTAEASALVGVTSTGDTGSSMVAEQLARQKVPSFVEIGSWRSVALYAIDELGLSDSPEALVNRVDVSNPTNTVILRVSANAGTPEEARDLAEAWIRGMIQVIDETEGGSEADSGAVNVTPGDSARLPTLPSSPNTRQNIALGGLIGLVLGVVYAAVRTVLDRRIRSREGVEQATGLAVVGSLPVTPTLTKEGQSLLPLVPGGETAKDVRLLAESMRELRTNLQYTNVDNPPRSIVITSPLPSDGKSTTASNLAIILAQAGQRVLLVDADLRKPRVAKLFGLADDAGLTDILAGRATVDDVVHEVDDEGLLSVITAGRIPPNPSEVLGSQRMLDLVGSLTASYLVLLDAPPLAPVTDAAILTTRADGALVVVGTGKTTFDALGQALASLTRVNAIPLGVVMNRVPTRGAGKASYGYEYRSYYGKVYESHSETAAVPVKASEWPEPEAHPQRALRAVE